MNGKTLQIIAVQIFLWVNMTKQNFSDISDQKKYIFIAKEI